MAAWRILVLLLLIAQVAAAQSEVAADTMQAAARSSAADSVRNKRKEKRAAILLKRPLSDPNKAFFYSAIFPGLGQIYNRKYWKAPIVWGGLIGGALLINYQQERYYRFKTELYGLLRDSQYTPPSGLNESQLRSETDNAQRNRDLFTAVTVVWYMLQALEAHVDAHLSYFHKNPKLKLSLGPAAAPPIGSTPYTGMALTLRF